MFFSKKLSKKQSVIVNIDQSLLPFDSSNLVSGAGMEICSVAQHVQHPATKRYTTDN